MTGQTDPRVLFAVVGFMGVMHCLSLILGVL